MPNNRVTYTAVQAIHNEPSLRYVFCRPNASYKKSLFAETFRLHCISVFITLFVFCNLTITVYRLHIIPRIIIESRPRRMPFAH